MEKNPCEKKECDIKPTDLPLCCPSLNERVWDGHPRVYLSFDDTKEVICPYCQTKYRLLDE